MTSSISSDEEDGPSYRGAIIGQVRSYKIIVSMVFLAEANSRLLRRLFALGSLVSAAFLE